MRTLKNMDFEITLTRGRVRNFMKECRKQAATSKATRPSTTTPLFKELRIAHVGNTLANRLALFLRGKGCAWAEASGGCTFCGFWSATNMGTEVRGEDLIEQIRKSLSHLSDQEASAWELALYNDGSLLDPQEIKFESLIEIVKFAKGMHGFKRLVLECKISDITEEKISVLAELLGDRGLLLAVGFESSNPLVRDVCINKPFSDSAFQRALCILKKYHFDMTALIIVQPPFLTEDESYTEVIKTIQYLDDKRLQRIDLELTTVQPFTLVEQLWRRGLYSPPSKKLIEKVLAWIVQTETRTPVFISPVKYSPAVLEMPSSELNDQIAAVNTRNAYQISDRLMQIEKLVPQNPVQATRLLQRINEFLNLLEMSSLPLEKRNTGSKLKSFRTEDLCV
ncbi:MAG: hypothetical protein HYV97_11335 [Bdellovibrio sp.]|nr:hypothetical protein [Bdellovibrio sp.]